MASFKVNLDGFDDIQRKLSLAASRAENGLAQKVAADTTLYVPALTLSMTNRTQVHGNMIIYPDPYARYLYQGKVMVNADTGKGPMKIVGENGVEVIRSRYGGKKVETNRDLNIQRTVHPYAQSHWFEASKANNLEKWLRVADKAVKDELK